MGRMGQQLIRSTYIFPKNNLFRIVSLTERRKINKNIFGLKPQLNSEIAFKKANVIIDFLTIPLNVHWKFLNIAVKIFSKKFVIGTTGFIKNK